MLPLSPESLSRAVPASVRARIRTGFGMAYQAIACSACPSAGPFSFPHLSFDPASASVFFLALAVARPGLSFRTPTVVNSILHPPRQERLRESKSTREVVRPCRGHNTPRDPRARGGQHSGQHRPALQRHQFHAQHIAGLIGAGDADISGVSQRRPPTPTADYVSAPAKRPLPPGNTRGTTVLLFPALGTSVTQVLETLVCRRPSISKSKERTSRGIAKVAQPGLPA